jgi:hypothetical protein
MPPHVVETICGHAGRTPDKRAMQRYWNLAEETTARLMEIDLVLWRVSLPSQEVRGWCATTSLPAYRSKPSRTPRWTCCC